MSIWADMSTIVTATLSGDINFKVVQAYRSEGAWFVFGPLTLIGAVLVHYLYRAVPWIDRHLERSIVVYAYIIMATIIFVGVIQRFAFNAQVPWSTTIPPLLFMIMAWYGCSFNVKLRTHLSFSEFRTSLPPKGQFSLLMMDNVLWMIFCIIVVTTTSRVTVNTYDNFAIVLGTDNVMRWWFIVTMPICFIFMAGRVYGNMVEDIANFRSGDQLIKQAVIGGDV
jgi:TRAP-type C4-dicarboxylate transport system permease small subunit